MSEVIARQIPEGTVPLVAVEGEAYDCGRAYAETVIGTYPGYRRYFDVNWKQREMSGEVRALFERRAPFMPDVLRGLTDVAGPPPRRQESGPSETGACTSFGVSGALTLDGQPISGQTKDTVVDSAYLYIVLRMRIKGGPTALMLCYPGELLGYGLWSTGMSLFRNSLHSRAGAPSGLTMEQWGWLTLAGASVEEGVELATRFGIADAGNCLISDATGCSLSVESNAGGVDVIVARDGIATHANHPEGPNTSPFEHYPNAVERENSRYRARVLWERLNAERGRLTPQLAMMALADHSAYPRGLCRHLITDDANHLTTAAVVAEPTRGRLHVTRGNPCANWPVTYTV